MISMKQQAGMSTIMLILVVGLFGYAIFVGLKVVPAYIDYFSIKSTVDSLADEMKTRPINKSQYMELLRRRLDINYIDVRSLKPQRDGCEKLKKDVFYYKRTKKKSVDIGMQYERRIPLVANIDVLLSFDYMRNVKNADN